MSVVIYHNPRCSKSRQTLQLLKDNGVEPEVVEYLADTPSKDEIKKIIKSLGISARDILRKKEDIYKEAGFDNNNLSEDEIISLMQKNPKVIERPIVVNGSKAAIGRPPENVLKVID
ncbi:MAG: arsenate reductase (glutaredoxin) [Rickettsiales bacterium]|nr:arsenate reductase (glutaredoxin) [Pseudomonadota bacterium]MDA0966778.1 arsenate reductase (glutaredoxin) [Pseudomonadota bacterium]MDG4543450.1 arsenate reductase (glutaredoxin) [Rickettsiales bacterium]MDG4546156.1 arsenate reductase (glutaredoxin) [Rickettsiales bacterium]MDG4547629.1 arsenate reductase (glutaredoxin) [Rickettsiales bacterium]